MNLFGKKKPVAAAPMPPPVDTIRELRAQLEILEKRENLMTQRVSSALQEATKKKQKGDTKGALFELKRKKMFEAEVSKLQGARITLDSQIMALESAAVNIETVKAMKYGADAMKKIRGNIDADAVDDIMENIAEEKDLHDTISEAISRPGQDMFDDDELLNELAELEALDVQATLSPQLQTQQPAVRSVFQLPQAPNAPLQHPANFETEDERSLRELQASMLA